MHYDNLLKKQGSPHTLQPSVFLLDLSPKLDAEHIPSWLQRTSDLSKLALTAPVYAQAKQKADFSGARNTGCFWDLKL